MSLPDLKFGAEWALLELLCLGLTDETEQAAFSELLTTTSLDWGILLEQALRHKLLPLLAFHTITTPPPHMPRRIREHLRLVLEINRHKRTLWYQEADRVIQALDKQGVRVFGRKDVTFESTLYNGNGSRRFGDIDLLIAPQDREAVTAALPQLGYQTGLFDWETKQLRPISRKNMLIFRMNPDHLPVYSRLSNDPIMPYFEVDFANSLTWHGSPYHVPLDLALANPITRPVAHLPAIKIPSLNPTYQFISTVLHLFREAWFARWLEWEQDVDLSKFSDVIRLWKRDRANLVDPAFVQTLEQLDLVKPMVWVLEHIDRTFHTTIVPSLGLAGRVDEIWLHSGRASGKQNYRWQGTMRDRLYSKNRAALFVTAEEVAA